jgi:hypothetical protein
VITWIQSHYELLGVGFAALAVFLAWLQLRKKDPVSTSLNKSAADNSAIISGSHNQVVIHPVSPGAGAQPQQLATPKIERVPERPKANIQYIDAFTMCLGDPFDKSPKNALAIRFSNDARPDVENVAASVRAKLLYFDGEKEIHAVTGNWLDEPRDYAYFKIDGRYTLVVGQVIRGKFHTLTKRKHHTGLHEFFQPEAEPLENFQTGTVIARLTNADTGKWIFEKRFKITVDPLSIEPIEERKLTAFTSDEALADEILSYAGRMKKKDPNRAFQEPMLCIEFDVTSKQVARAMDNLFIRGRAKHTGFPGVWQIYP